MSKCPTCPKSFDTETAMKIHHAKAHGEKLQPTSTCEQCGEDFKHRAAKDRKFCSERCSQLHKRKRVTKHCGGCDSEFEVQEAMADAYEYCSMECRSKAAKIRSVCEECGRPFVHKKHKDRIYCSKPCQHKAVGRGNKSRVTSTCKNCQSEFSHQPSDERVFCSRECQCRHLSQQRHQKAVEKVKCEHCAEVFIGKKSDERTYCSRKCAVRHRNEKEGKTLHKTCPFCKRGFRTSQYDDHTFCTNVCYHEYRKNRPTDVRELAVELYHEENRSLTDTVQRIPRKGRQSIKEILEEEGVYREEMHRKLMRIGEEK